MSATALNEISNVSVFRKRVKKTLNIENISILKPGEKICFDVELNNNTYILNIGTLSNEDFPYVCVSVDQHKDNSKQDIELDLKIMDREVRQIFQKTEIVKPISPIAICTNYTIRNLPPTNVMFHIELSCICWTVDGVPASGNPDERKKKTESVDESLSRDFGRLFSQKTNSDVVIQVGNAEIPAHSQILSARSGVFAAMFKHEKTEKSSRTIQISDIGALAMHHFLVYIYTGKLEINNLRLDILRQLLAAAEKYEVMELKDMCMQRLCRITMIEEISGLSGLIKHMTS